MTAALIGKQPALVTIHGSRLGLSQVDTNDMAGILLDGYNVGGLSGVAYQSGTTGIAALAGGGQTSLSSFIINAEVNILNTVATASDSVMLPSTAGKIPTGGSISVSIINASSIAAALFPSSGDTINALAANASLALGTSTATVLYCVSSGKWYSK
jgi:hypothetical protein